MAKRVRTVFPTDEIAHLWFHKTQASARNGGRNNFYFEGDTIYSYGSHFPIARHVINGNGDAAVLFTTRKFSNTTAKHIGIVRSAIPHSTPVFYVPNVTNRWDLEFDPAQPLAQLEDTAKTARTTLDAQTRKPSIVKAYRVLRDADTAAAEYARFFGLTYVPRIPANVAELQALDAEYTVKETERRARLDAARAARWAARSEQWRRDREQREAEAAEDAALTLEQRIERWRNGGRLSGSYYGYGDYTIPTMLRISADGTEVETSRGARFPIAHAVQGLKLVRRVRNSGLVLDPARKQRLGHYAIDAVAEDGTVTAGCHVVPYAEIERIAPALDAWSAAHKAEAQEVVA